MNSLSKAEAIGKKSSCPHTCWTVPARPLRIRSSSRRDEVLARLLALNAARTGAEAGPSVPGRPGKSRPVDAGDILGSSI